MDTEHNFPNIYIAYALSVNDWCSLWTSKNWELFKCRRSIETVQKWYFLISHAPNHHTVIPQLLPRDLLETTMNESLPHCSWKPGLMQGSEREGSFHICLPHIVPGNSEPEFRTCPWFPWFRCIYLLYRQEQMFTTTPWNTWKNLWSEKMS